VKLPQRGLMLISEKTQLLASLFIRLDTVSYFPGWRSDVDAMWFRAAGDDASCADDSAFSNVDSTQDNAVRTNPAIALDDDSPSMARIFQNTFANSNVMISSYNAAPRRYECLVSNADPAKPVYICISVDQHTLSQTYLPHMKETNVWKNKRHGFNSLE
jgi:hypothetical protein